MHPRHFVEAAQKAASVRKAAKAAELATFTTKLDAIEANVQKAFIRVAVQFLAWLCFGAMLLWFR